MKRKTYRNVVRATNIIMKKGYSKEEANDIAIRIFDEHENSEMSIEFYLDKIATKEEWKSKM